MLPYMVLLYVWDLVNNVNEDLTSKGRNQQTGGESPLRKMARFHIFQYCQDIRRSKVSHHVASEEGRWQLTIWVVGK